jgi:hypothetical protein
MIGALHLAMAGALAACVAGIGGFFYGTRVGAAQEQSARKRADDAAEAVRMELQAKIDASSERAQAVEYARQSSVREIYHESQKIIERPVYRNVCTDADGVRLLDRAAAAANGASFAEPSGPAAAASQRPQE